MRFSGRKANDGDNESTLSVSGKKESEGDKILLLSDIFRAQVQSEISMRQTFQEQIQQLTLQLQQTRADMSKLTDENISLIQELRKERSARQRLEMEVSLEKGKVQGFESLVRSSGNTDHFVASSAPEPAPAMNASERREALSQLEVERKTQQELTDITRDLLSFLEQPRRVPTS